jgi:hypothetical protein
LMSRRNIEFDELIEMVLLASEAPMMRAIESIISIMRQSSHHSTAPSE